MKRTNIFFASLFSVFVLCSAMPFLEQEYKIEAFRKDGDAQILVLRIQQSKNTETFRQGRQEDEDEDAAPAVPNTTPFIPAVLPALTKIFTGIITGNLNEIFHGSTSFAPQNISHAIDTVYNQVVGLPAPVSTLAPSQLVTTLAPPPPPVPSPAPAAPATVSSSPAVASAQPGQPLQGQSLVITSSTTSKPNSNEDDEDESDADNFGFKRLRKNQFQLS